MGKRKMSVTEGGTDTYLNKFYLIVHAVWIKNALKLLESFQRYQFRINICIRIFFLIVLFKYKNATYSLKLFRRHQLSFITLRRVKFWYKLVITEFLRMFLNFSYTYVFFDILQPSAFYFLVIKYNILPQ